jgi:hypothetical protein
VDLIRNYGVFNKINFSVPTDDFFQVYNKFQKQLNGSYANFYWINENATVSEVVTPYGLCFTFNFPNVDDFLDTNSTSDNFHIGHFFTVSSKKDKDTSLPRKISTSIDGLYVLFYIDYKPQLVESDFDGLLFFVHEPFELPVQSTPKFIAKSYQPTYIKINPEIHSIDDSLVGYSPEE